MEGEDSILSIYSTYIHTLYLMYTEVYISEMCKELGCMQIIASCNKSTSYYQGHAKLHTYTVFSLLH